MTYVIIIAAIVLFIYFVKTTSKQADNNTSNFTPANNATNTPTFNVSFLHKQSDEDKKVMGELEKKYPKWYSGEKTRGLCFERDRIEPLPNGQTEKIHYKTDRFAELFGRGKDVSYFPGYGKIYNRTFEIWYRKKGGKDKEGVMEYRDIGLDKYAGPFFAEKITGGMSINNSLKRTSGYIKLYNVRDDKNGKTWYAGLKGVEFTGIITDRELE